TPGAAGDDVAVCDHFGTVTLVDAPRGTTRWQTPLRVPILDTRVVLTSHAVVIRTYGGSIVVLDRESGRGVRRRDPGGFPLGVGVGGGRLGFAGRLAPAGPGGARPPAWAGPPATAVPPGRGR